MVLLLYASFIFYLVDYEQAILIIVFVLNMVHW